MKFTLQRLQAVVLLISTLAIFAACQPQEKEAKIIFYPQQQAKNINPDAHLKLTFKAPPKIGTLGKIRVYDSETDAIVDELDLSIPAGPTEERKNPEATYTPEPYVYSPSTCTNANTKAGTPSGLGQATADSFQLTIIGGFSDAFHFYPIIVHENTATIYLHHNLLRYGKSYYVLMDSSVLHTPDGSFQGIYNKNEWQFHTRTTPPPLSQGKFVVDDSGKGDFNTLQGALDFIPDFYEDTVEIFIRKGLYEELVYFRNKTNVVIRGESRDSVCIQYANNEVFNPHPWNIKTNEWPGTFPSRRAAFAMDHCRNIQLCHLTVKTLLPGQAEGLLINGEQIFVKDVHIVGDGDALQCNGTAYFEHVLIHGGGDMILGRGAAFFKDCDFYSPGPFMWVRNTQTNHGNVFLNCRFTGTNPMGAELARAPENKGYNYPYAEAVLLNCALQNIVPQGWGPVGKDVQNLHYWEYNSSNISDGQPADISKRSPYSRQLKAERDEALISAYSNPAFVLGGWLPQQIN